MLEKLYRDGFLDYSKLIIKYAKSLGLNAEEAFILIKILDICKKHNLRIFADGGTLLGVISYGSYIDG